jgi:hypothetical protein
LVIIEIMIGALAALLLLPVLVLFLQVLLASRVRQFKVKNGVFWKAPHVAMRFSGRFL